MKPATMFIVTMVGGLIGSVIGAYVGFKLWNMYGALSIIPIFGLIIIIIGVIYLLIFNMVEKVPAIKVLEYNDPEDEYPDDKPE